MIVRVKVAMASSTWSFHPGQLVEVPTEVAKAWREAGLAEKPNETKPIVIDARTLVPTAERPRDDGDGEDEEDDEG